MDYLENGISWARVCRMMADLPDYSSDDTEKTVKPIKVTEQNASDLMKMFNKS